MICVQFLIGAIRPCQYGREQLQREAAAAGQARRWLFCDTSPMTTYFYCVEMFGKAEPELARRGIFYVTVSGTVQARVKQVARLLA